MRIVTLHGYNVSVEPLIDGAFQLLAIAPNQSEVVQLPLKADVARDVSRALSGLVTPPPGIVDGNGRRIVDGMERGL